MMMKKSGNNNKQKILNKLEELERIQRFNEEKLTKDLDLLDKRGEKPGGYNNTNRSQEKITSVKITDSVMMMGKKKNVLGPINGSSADRKDGKVSSLSKHKNLNYEDKIKQLEAKLFSNGHNNR